MGNGDLLTGLNPADDTVDNIGACLIHLDKKRRQTGAPTQVCVLSHIRTQLACLEEGAPLEILFQSLAGTDATLREAFDVSVPYMDNKAAGNRLNAILGSRMGLSDIIRESKVEPQNKKQTAIYPEFAHFYQNEAF